MPTPAEILPIAEICEFLAADDEAKQTFLKGGFLRKGLSRLIYIVRSSVQWLYDTFPSDSTLVQKANYLYWLCTPYIAKANAILGQGGSGGIINPSTGTASTVTGYQLQFMVGDVGAPMNAGDTVLVITLNDWINLTFHAYLDGVRTPQNVMTQISYTIAYNPTNVTFTFNQGVQNGQLYIIDGLRLQPVVTPAAQETFFTVNTYANMIALAIGNYYREFLVLNDENKGLERTVYQFWPGSPDRIEWIAATNEL